MRTSYFSLEVVSMKITLVVVSEFLFVLERSTTGAALETAHLLRLAGTKSTACGMEPVPRHEDLMSTVRIPAFHEASVLHATAGGLS